MAKYEIKYVIDADSPEDAKKIVEALDIIYKMVEDKDLIVLAKAIEKRPGLIKQALKFI